MTLRVLLLSDTHLGFDLPARPRAKRRRRGPDFFESFLRALEPARKGEVHAVVHGGDLLFRSKVPSWLVVEAMAPLFEVADRGVPIFLVPGNHERSRIPYPLLTSHPLIHIFDRPRTFTVTSKGIRASLSGFPFARRIAGGGFASRLDQSGWGKVAAEIRLLCFHQAVEGARVKGHTFRRGADVLEGRQVPRGFAAILSGHIHRAQILARDLRGDPFAAPVIYPGSTERTSFAERDEPKGFFVLEFEPSRRGGRLLRKSFNPLPTRPMVVLEIDVEDLDEGMLRRTLRSRLEELHPDSIVRARPRGKPKPGAERVFSAKALRSLAPKTMNIDVDRWQNLTYDGRESRRPPKVRKWPIAPSGAATSS